MNDSEQKQLPAQCGTLYCIPTPIAADHPIASDLPTSTLERAAGIDYVIAESAKSARAFLKKLALTRPIQSIEIVELNNRTPDSAIEPMLATLLTGRNAALVSEAGCPGIADPGARLVRAAHLMSIPVMPMIGPSAILLTLVGAGLNGQCFGFVGYLPTDTEARRARIRSLEQRSRHNHETVVFIETPYRNEVMFKGLLETLEPTTWLCVATNLTGADSSLKTARISEWQGSAPPQKRLPTVFALLAA
jgi:16S rRNA (cytidine1402-2'-O)-methyltransferase